MFKTLQTKSYLGKTKPLKNPKTQKELDKFITNNPQVISDILFDGKGISSDFNSFETIWALIESGKSKSLYDKRKAIAIKFNERIVKPKKIDLPDEIKKYL